MARCKIDARLLGQLFRGHQAFEQPAPGFAVVRLELRHPTNISALVLPSVWLLASVRNVGPCPVTLHWSCSAHCSIEGEGTSVEPWPANPKPPLSGRFAMPCRSCDSNLTEHPSNYHDTWLHGTTDTALEILTVMRGEDDTSMYTNWQFGVALAKGGCWLWGSGMFGSWDPYDKWHVVKSDMLLVLQARCILDGATRATPDEAILSKLRDWEDWSVTKDVFSISPETRLRWNRSFHQFGSRWVLAPDPEYTQESIAAWKRAGAAANGWWIATDLYAIIQRTFAIRLQGLFRRSLADPHFDVCRRRLLREFEDLHGVGGRPAR